MKKIYLFAFLCFSGVAFAQAPLLVEDFNYSAGDALTAHGWSIHSGTSNPLVVTSPGLTFNGYVGSAIGLATSLNNTGDDENKSFGAQTAPGSIYASFMVNIPTNTASASYFFHFFDPTASTAFRARTFLKPVNGKVQVGFSFNASAAQDSLPNALLNFGQTYLFVVKYTIVDGATNDNVSLFVFAEGDNFASEPAKPSLGPLTATLSSGSLASDIVPTCVALRQWDANQRITVDGIRVKTFWQLDKDNPTGLNPIIVNQNLEFYPNPVTDGYLNLTNVGNSLKDIEIFDVVGKKVMSQQTLLSKVDVSKLKGGMYVLKVLSDSQSYSSKLVIK